MKKEHLNATITKVLNCREQNLKHLKQFYKNRQEFEKLTEQLNWAVEVAKTFEWFFANCRARKVQIWHNGYSELLDIKQQAVATLVNTLNTAIQKK